MQDKQTDPLEDIIKTELTPEEILREQLWYDAFRHVLSDPNGRRFLWGFMGKLGFMRTPFAGKDSTTNFNCGMHNAALLLYAEMEIANPQAFHIMVKESQQEDQYVRNTINESTSNVGSFDSVATIRGTGKPGGNEPTFF